MKTLGVAVFFGCLFLSIGYIAGSFVREGYINEIHIEWQREQMDIMRTQAQNTLHRLFRDPSDV